MPPMRQAEVPAAYEWLRAFGSWPSFSPFAVMSLNHRSFPAFMRLAQIPEPVLLPLQAYPWSACAVFFLPSFSSFPTLSDVYHADNWVLAIYHPFVMREKAVWIWFLSDVENEAIDSIFYDFHR
jgi:hypothetical protein